MKQQSSPTNQDVQNDEELMIAEMISDWLIRIHSHDPLEQEAAQHAYQQWKTQNPQHLAIAEKLENCFAQMQLLQQQPQKNKQLIRPLFKPKGRRHKHGIKYGLLLMAGFIPLAVYLQQNSPRYLLADVRSKTGEWRTETLDDGTQITLKNKTAFNVRYSDEQRIIELVTGDILIDVASDQSRPFTVLVEQGSIRALGTKFSVQYQAEYTDLTMLESRVLAQSNSNSLGKNLLQSRQVKAGERIYLTSHGIQTMPNVDIENIEYEWLNQTLVAEEQPLSDVLDKLNQHHRGKIYYDQKKMANIKVTAVVPLNDTDQAIKLLQHALPQLGVHHVGGYVYWMDESK